MGAKKQKKWGIDINVLSNSNIKKTMSDKALFAEKAKAANAMLDELAKARKTKESVPGSNVKKFLKKYKQKRFETDIDKIKPENRNAYTQQLLYFTEHPASNLQNLLEMQSARRENFIDQIIKYTDASEEDKKVLGDYLRSLSANELNKIVDFYEPVLNKGLKRDSDEKFQFIGNDMIQKANKEDKSNTSSAGQQLLSTAKDIMELNHIKEIKKDIFSEVMSPIVQEAEAELFDFYLSNFEPGADPDDPNVIAGFEAAKAAVRNADDPLKAMTSYIATNANVLYKIKMHEYDAMREEAAAVGSSDKDLSNELYKAADAYKDEVVSEFKDNKDEVGFINSIMGSIEKGDLGAVTLKSINFFINPSKVMSDLIKDNGMKALDNIDVDTRLTEGERSEILRMIGDAAKAVTKSDEMNKFFNTDYDDKNTYEGGDIETLTDEANKALSEAHEKKKEKREEEIEQNQKIMKVAGKGIWEFAKSFILSGGNVAVALGDAASSAVKEGVKQAMTPSKKKKKKKKGEQAEAFKANVEQYKMKADPNAPDTAKNFGKALGVKMRDPHKVEKRPQKKSTGLTIEKLKKVRGIYR